MYPIVTFYYCVPIFISLSLSLNATAGFAGTATEVPEIAHNRSTEQHFSIPAQSLSTALFAWSQQTNMAVTAPAHLLKGLQAPALEGRLTPEQALRHLLAGTKLRLIPGQEGFIIAVPRKIVPAPSQAPEPELQPEWIHEPVIEEVAVTASRATNRTAIEQKQTIATISDILASDDMGDLPDLNLADAFRRITGVSTINDSDEGRFVTLRGIEATYNLVTLDGVAIATDQGNTHNINLESFPIIGIHSLQVHKTRTANMDGYRIGGMMNIRSLSAYEQDGPLLLIDGALSKYSLDDTPDDDDGLSGKFTFTYADLFGSDDQFGLVLAGTYEEKNRDEQQWEPGFRYLPQGSGLADAPFRDRFEMKYYTNTWVRRGASLKLEYQPTADLYAFVKGYYYSKSENEDRDKWSVSNDAGDAVTLNGRGGGATNLGKGAIQYRNREIERGLGGVHMHAKLHLTDRHSLSTDLSHSRGRHDFTEDKIEWQTASTLAARQQMGYAYANGAAFPAWQLNNPSYATDAANYRFRDLFVRFDDIDDRVTEFKLDYGYKLDEAEGLAWQSGLSWRKHTRDWNKHQLKSTWTGSTNLLLSDFVDHQFLIPSHFNDPMIFQDEDVFFVHFRDQPADFNTEIRLVNAGDAGDVTYDADMQAVYGLLRYGFGNILFDASLNAGVRYERYVYESHGFLRNINTATLTPNTVSHDYHHWLPSISLDLWFSDELRLNSAWSQSLGRQSLQDTNAVASARLDLSQQTLTINLETSVEIISTPSNGINFPRDLIDFSSSYASA